MFEAEQNGGDSDAFEAFEGEAVSDVGRPEQVAFEDLDFVPPDQVTDAFKAARQKLSKQGQELHDLRRDYEQLQRKQQEMMAVLQDPDALSQLVNYNQSRSSGSNLPSVEKAAEKAGIDPETAKALHSFFSEMGVLTSYDPRVVEFQQAVQGIRGQTLQQQFTALEQKYPGAAEYAGPAMQLMQSAGLDPETALIAASKGELVRRQASAKAKQQNRVAAQVAPASPQSIPQAGSKAKLSLMDAFGAAAKQHGIDLKDLSRLRRTRG